MGEISLQQETNRGAMPRELVLELRKPDLSRHLHALEADPTPLAKAFRIAAPSPGARYLWPICCPRQLIPPTFANFGQTVCGEYHRLFGF